MCALYRAMRFIFWLMEMALLLAVMKGMICAPQLINLRFELLKVIVTTRVLHRMKN